MLRRPNDKMAIFVINVTFIEKQEHIYKPEIVKTIEISHLEKAATAYCEEEPAPTFDVAEVCAALGIANMSEAKAYIVNLTDGNFVENTGSPTGINGINADAKADIIYNINGVRTTNMNQKGVYIQNGKKVLVK